MTTKMTWYISVYYFSVYYSSYYNLYSNFLNTLSPHPNLQTSRCPRRISTAWKETTNDQNFVRNSSIVNNYKFTCPYASDVIRIELEIRTVRPILYTHNGLWVFRMIHSHSVTDFVSSHFEQTHSWKQKNGLRE